MIIWSGRNAALIICFLISLAGFAGPTEEPTTKVEILRSIPSVGMQLTYLIYSVIDGQLYPPARLTIRHSSFEDPNNETIKTVLSVTYHLGWIAGAENGSAIENATSRHLIDVEVPAGRLLEALYGIYFNQSMANFTPWYIFPENISIGSSFKAFNVTFYVVDEEAAFASRVGTLDVWMTEFNRTEGSIDYEISLFYEKISGILVAGKFRILWERYNHSYDEKFHLIETNAFIAKEVNERVEHSIDISWTAIALIALIPFALIAFRFLRLRKLKGGLD
ncbi:MAG: hypothetical protein ACFFGZ_03910 [Candidatus Thorarchaeota archaeon]